MKKSVRRSKGSGSIFKKYGVYYYQWVTPDGVKKIRRLQDEEGASITERVKAVKAAQSIAEEIYSAHRIVTKMAYMTEMAEARNLISSVRLPIQEMWEAYLKSPRRPDSSSSTLDFYHDAVLPFQKWMAARHREIHEVRDVTEEIACEYASDFWASGVSERTYNARITSLKMIFKVLLKGETPFDPIRRKTPRQQSRNAFTAVQLKAISDTMDNPEYYMLHKAEMRLMLLMMLYTGCRGEDAALMKWDCINFEERIIKYIPLKTGRRRPVPVTVPIAECLYEALRKKEHDDLHFVLPHVADRYQRNPCGISLDITKLIEASGIVTRKEDPTLQRKRPVVLYSMHSFRHTFCTLAVNAGIPLSTIQEIVGHSTEAMTSHYSHISLESKQKAIQAITDETRRENNAVKLSFAEHLPNLTPDQLAVIGRWMDEHLTGELRIKAAELCV